MCVVILCYRCIIGIYLGPNYHIVLFNVYLFFLVSGVWSAVFGALKNFLNFSIEMHISW
jgi:hypothetical protein